MNPFVYIDGSWVSKENAKVSVFDHGLLYGDGVFEGIRAYNGHVFRLDQHLDRLYRSAEKIHLMIPIEQSALKMIVKESLVKNNLKDAYIRLLITRGVGDLGLDIRACPKPSIICISDKLALYSAQLYEDGLSAIVSSVRRNLVDALDPSIKSMNYLNMILANTEAKKKGVPEAIMLNVDGYVSECSGDNIFIVKGNNILTPSVEAGVLVGITRGVVIELVQNKTKFSIKESLFKPDELYKSDEIFFTGTAAEVIPVTMINDHKIGSGRPGPITKNLIQLFHNLTRQESIK